MATGVTVVGIVSGSGRMPSTANTVSSSVRTVNMTSERLKGSTVTDVRDKSCIDVEPDTLRRDLASLRNLASVLPVLVDSGLGHGLRDLDRFR